MRAMLNAINVAGYSSISETYSLLRVLAAFPLDIDLDANSDGIRRALDEDDHPLAVLSHSALVSVLATNTRGNAIVTQLQGALKRKRENEEGPSQGPSGEFGKGTRKRRR
jgi:hypothetical protein